MKGAGGFGRVGEEAERRTRRVGMGYSGAEMGPEDQTATETPRELTDPEI